MADVPQRIKPPQQRTSFAEMAAKVAQKSHTNRPPAEAVSAPPPSTPTGASGLIHLQDLPSTPSLAPATRSVTVDETHRPVEHDAGPLQKKRGAQGLLVGVLIALAGGGVAYALGAPRGIQLAGLWGPKAIATSAPAAAVVPEEESPKAEATMAAPSPKTTSTGAGSVAHPAMDLPADPRGSHPVAARTPRAADHTTVTTNAAVAARAAEAPSPAPAPQPTPAAQSPGPEPNTLAGAIKKAAGPTEQAAAIQVDKLGGPALRGDIPDTPATGAIQGAIGAQRGVARACVAGDDSPSRATIVFVSTGKVQSVSVTGPAAGTPAENCIRGALSKTTVGPFRRPSFSVSTTISPP